MSVLLNETEASSEFAFATRTNRLSSSAIREILKVAESPDVISFAGGLPAPEFFPVSEFADACREVLATDGAQALQYSTTEGYAPLRRWVCEYLAQTGAIRCEPDQVLIVSGSQQGLDLVAKVLLDPGDFVVIENPAYLGAVQAFDAYEAAYLTVETDDEGMIPEALDQVLRSAPRKPKFIYVVANFANPTGVTLTLERRRQIVAIAAEHGVPILEDDPYGRLRYSGNHLPSLMSLAAPRDVVYMSTASKTMAPGMRVAWVVIPDAPMYHRVVQAKQAADLHTSSFTQRVVYAYASRPGVLEAHVDSMLPAYRRRRDLMLEMLEKSMPAGTTWTRPGGGLFLWVRLASGVDTQPMLARAVGQRVAFVPGAPFWVNRSVRNTLRLNFSNSTEEKIVDGIKRLASVM